MKRSTLTLALATLASTLALSSSPAASQARIGQSFTTPTTDFFLQSVITGEMSSLAGPTTFALFAMSGDSLSGPALFEQTFPDPDGVASYLTLNVNRLLAPDALYGLFIASDRLTASSIGDMIPGGEFNVCNISQPCFKPFAPGADVQGFTLNFTAPANVTPEPVSMALLGTGLFGVGVVRRRRTKAPEPA